MTVRIKRCRSETSARYPREYKHVLGWKGKVCECIIEGRAARHFDPKSLRTLKDQPKLGYYMIVGCPKGQFRVRGCQVGTEPHKIMAPMSKCR